MISIFRCGVALQQQPLVGQVLKAPHACCAVCTKGSHERLQAWRVHNEVAEDPLVLEASCACALCCLRWKQLSRLHRQHALHGMVSSTEGACDMQPGQAELVQEQGRDALCFSSQFQSQSMSCCSLSSSCLPVSLK